MDRTESVFVENKQTSHPIEIQEVKKTAIFVLDQEGAPLADVTVTFTDPVEMAALNKLYRGIDGPTDVLSFSMTEIDEGGKEPEYASPEAILGDVVICPDVAAKNAADLGRSTEREILEITIHGLLHLLGYTHDNLSEEQKMFARQEELAGLTK